MVGLNPQLFIDKSYLCSLLGSLLSTVLRRPTLILSRYPEIYRPHFAFLKHTKYQDTKSSSLVEVTQKVWIECSPPQIAGR